jgi:hypothetical protein
MHMHLLLIFVHILASYFGVPFPADWGGRLATVEEDGCQVQFDLLSMITGSSNNSGGKNHHR